MVPNVCPSDLLGHRVSVRVVHTVCPPGIRGTSVIPLATTTTRAVLLELNEIPTGGIQPHVVVDEPRATTEVDRVRVLGPLERVTVNFPASGPVADALAEAKAVRLDGFRLDTRVVFIDVEDVVSRDVFAALDRFDLVARIAGIVFDQVILDENEIAAAEYERPRPRILPRISPLGSPKLPGFLNREDVAVGVRRVVQRIVVDQARHHPSRGPDRNRTFQVRVRILDGVKVVVVDPETTESCGADSSTFDEHGTVIRRACASKLEASDSVEAPVVLAIDFEDGVRVAGNRQRKSGRGLRGIAAAGREGQPFGTWNGDSGVPGCRTRAGQLNGVTVGGGSDSAGHRCGGAITRPDDDRRRNSGGRQRRHYRKKHRTEDHYVSFHTLLRLLARKSSSSLCRPGGPAMRLPSRRAEGIGRLEPFTQIQLLCQRPPRSPRNVRFSFRFVTSQSCRVPGPGALTSGIIRLLIP